MRSGVGSPHVSARRAQLLEQLIVALTATDPDTLAITTRAPDDPTIALLDAWATVGDVIGFYQDRIAEEGYLSSATQPGSILALAGLVGYQPLPGVAAQVCLAYALAADPDDNEVLFGPGLLFQSVPGPGEQPQTFETATSLVTRPSWNLLAARSTTPVEPSDTTLLIAGTTANLAPNDVLLVAISSQAAPLPVRVQATSVDHAEKLTTVTLQGPAIASHDAPAPKIVPPPPPPSVAAAIDALVKGGLGRSAASVPASAAELTATPRTVFRSGSDSVARMVSTLQPAVAPTLYAALDTTTVGSPPVTGVSRLRAVAAPFGAAAPPKITFDDTGRPAGTQDWPIADTFTLQATVSQTDFVRLLDRALGDFASRMAGLLRLAVRDAVTEDPVIQLTAATGEQTVHATLDVTSGGIAPATPSPFGEVTLTSTATEATLTYAGSDTPATPSIAVTATIDSDTDAVTFAFGADGSQTWDPTVRTPFTAQVGNAQLSIAWSTAQDGERAMTATLVTPLALESRDVLLLDATYGTVLDGSWIVVDRADVTSAAMASTDPTYPLVARVSHVDTVAASGFGITAKVTRLELESDWIGPDAVLQSSLRPLTVHVAPTPLAVQPAARTDDVRGSTIDLGTLVSGMLPGRLIAVTGTRTDLPGTASVPAGEIATIASVTAGGGKGQTSFSTLHLASELSYTYERSSVQVYGNLVTAHQGATIDEVLGSGQPAQAPQTFVLSAGPVLADTRSEEPGFQSSLTITVDGLGYAEADRFDDSTAPRTFLTGTDATGKTTITFPAPLPPGMGNVSASYRVGDGSQGNARAGQVTQLLTRPASLSQVTNPLPGSGGSGGQTQASVTAGIPVGPSSLGRIVTVSDYASLASSFAGVGKASAALASVDGRRAAVVTIAGNDPVALDPDGSLCGGVEGAIAAAADPSLQVFVIPATLFPIVLTADVVHDPLVGWDATVTALRAALRSSFGYDARDLGQDVMLSDLVAAAHTVPAVRSFTVTGLALVPVSVSAQSISGRLPGLLAAPVPQVSTAAAAAAMWQLTPAAGAPVPASIAYLADTSLDALILTETAP